MANDELQMKGTEKLDYLSPHQVDTFSVLVIRPRTINLPLKLAVLSERDRFEPCDNTDHEFAMICHSAVFIIHLRRSLQFCPLLVLVPCPNTVWQITDAEK